MRSRHLLAPQFFRLPSFGLNFWVGVGGVIVGTAAGMLAGANPLYLSLALGAVILVVYFFADFERAVLGLLIVRSSIDTFTIDGMPSALQQIPAVFAIGLDALTLLYVIVLLLTRKTVHIDRFWFVFAGWILLQSVWVILLVLGGLGLNAAFLPDSIREWMRISTWLMVYLLVMQLKGRIPPDKIISLLFLSLIPHVILGLMQIFVPSLLPPQLVLVASSDVFRAKGAAGHPNSFAVYLWLFIALTWWKLILSKRRWPWILLLSLLVFLLVATKTLIVLVLLATFFLVLNAHRLNLPNLISGIILFSIVLGLFASTDVGKKRLSAIAQTPLLNPNIDPSRAILMSHWDYNSFNWRIGQWTYLLNAWQQAPILGYGLGTSIEVSTNQLLPHNDYIRFLVEGGIVGLIIYISFFSAQVVHLVLLLRTTPRESAQHKLCLTLLAILLSIPIGMLSENIWSCTAFYFYWWTIFAIAGWNWNKLQTQPSMSSSPIGAFIH